MTETISQQETFVWAARTVGERAGIRVGAGAVAGTGPGAWFLPT